MIAHHLWSQTLYHGESWLVPTSMHSYYFHYYLCKRNFFDKVIITSTIITIFSLLKRELTVFSLATSPAPVSYILFNPVWSFTALFPSLHFCKCCSSPEHLMMASESLASRVSHIICSSIRPVLSEKYLKPLKTMAFINVGKSKHNLQHYYYHVRWLLYVPVLVLACII